MEPLEFFSAILLNTDDPGRLAAFYRDTLGLPLEENSHAAEHDHYECMVGELHFAIHPNPSPIPGGSIDIAFHVFDLQATVAALEKRGVKFETPPTDYGFSWLAALRDPAGNRIWLSQVTPRMIAGFTAMRAEGVDLLQRAANKA